MVLNPSRLRVIAVGKIRKPWIREGLETYRKRLPGLVIHEVKDSIPARERDQILAILQPEEIMLALSEEGSALDSIAWAHGLDAMASGRIAFVIGGAFGLDADLKARAHRILSLSPMTFPHELARLILIEQIYRAQSILQGSPYHKA
ncbi:23S rRNA (pseudouridine(1915)-N(3))-methyltransferase RlmH [Synechococcus sp. CCY9201]|uniref:23S rRNA (pseudouridine(1915)-N(3))-methyltransferase RlmH n=1 Tax=unclassified Synechococcus TaxID=2626047 RepID=UPI002AD2E0DB|nr:MULTISPECIES: 23S rRNA (pseudouridine(1915)-N(3))-methyltransferase RlmH [unclassified Synechococcus]MEA5422819.1 23S rRNA (pseudouridine(1915)-N(3))-methyltransferase RlmH [Synechococcus sp. CCY9202]MEA5475275.1 23S rRNA (pseudouridine(1915)-N(3))-methyltransferase RlmH [Synechococcus sp. CCY9201]CAK6699416.1 Ribosomal RNA large subunit methyltransferase H [Synechococcus sp. CBW1107]